MVISTSSPWAPFRSRAFAVLWIATLASNVGTWMNDVGAGWLMTSLAPSPLMVAMVQTATTLPIFLFALPAGALADIIDRRKLLVVVQGIMALLAASLSVLVFTDQVTSSVLLVFTFLLGTCAAFVAPAWQAIVPSLVKKSHLQSAVALNGVGINISRAIGPAIAGFLIAGIGIWAPFALNAISFLGVILALIWWRPKPQIQTVLPAEHFWSAITIGIRYARHSVPLKIALVRAIAFFLFASAFWSLLPLVVRSCLNGGPSLYGVLLGCIGIGAVSGALLLPPLRKRWSADRMVNICTCLIAITLLLNAFIHNSIISAVASFLFGMGWIGVLSTLNLAAQTAVPDWVRARGLSIFLMVFFGSMSMGSLMWGGLASFISLPIALAIAAVGALIAIPLVATKKLHVNEGDALAPSVHWPQPLLNVEEHADVIQHGPVMVTIEYHINPDDVGKFLQLMEELGKARKRSGVFAWFIMQDAANAEHFTEYFMENSWVQHLRHHERVSTADQIIQDKIHQLHQGINLPKVSHHFKR
ncbi:MFS transporter [Marinomonas lutimaris]|uniref:MFS transporter n=1 Tax=Marinomonas lutimaris TaxID=2846746 RepID=UPI001C67E78F|nr:MFS transporter [Marinomonas lutimaris]